MTAVDAGIKIATEPVPASSATTQTIDLGVSVFGSIETSGDQDWFRVDLVAGQTYEFRLHGFGLAELVDTFLRLYGPNGVTLLTSNDDSASWDGANAADSRIVFTATQTGAHYISAGGFGTNTGSYLLTAVPQNPSGMVFTPDEIAWQLIHNYNEQYGSEVAWNVGADRALTVNITGLTAAGQTLARAALQTWSDVTGIIFQEIASAAEITFDDSDAGVNAYANWSYSGTTIVGASVMITTGWLNQFGTSFGSYSFETYIHEIGHALGLGHGGNYNGSATYGVDNYYLNDCLHLSIMSYMQAIGDNIGGPNTFVGADFRAMLTPALADIIAVNMLYGRSTATRTGDTTYGYNANTGSAVLNSFVTTPDAFMTVHDDGGTDKLDFSGYAGAQRIDLNAGASSNVMGGVYNLWISRSTTIENAIGGGGADTIIGNAANNTLNGGGGADQMYGGGGNDVYHVDNDSDAVFEINGPGYDYVLSSAMIFTQGDWVELLIVLGDNRSGVSNSTGSTLQAVGQNIHLYGGAGNDIFYFTDSSTVVTEIASSGFDTVIYAGTGGSVTLSANAEALALTGAGSSGFGNNAGNSLLAFAANCHLWGGTGNDYYVVTESTVVIHESGGFDVLLANTSYYLQPDSVEQLYVIAANGIGVANAAGGVVFAANANVTLVSGAGNDTLYGNGMNTTYEISILDFGDDQIQGFTTTLSGLPHDVVDLRIFGFASFASLNIVDTPYGAMLQIGDDSLLFAGVSAAQLSATDFYL